MPELNICGRKGCHNEIPFNKYNFSRVKYCSRKCRQMQTRLRYSASTISQISGLSKGKIGAAGELQVCIDLIKKGYDVFRAIAASCPCDMVAMKKGKLFRIEVKSVTKRKDGSFVQPNLMNISADIVAAVFDDEIEYEPSLDSFWGLK